MSTPTVPPPAGEQLAPRQIQVLGELNAVVSTLEAIDSALDDVNNLISKDHESSIYCKQSQALKSLKKWESMIKKSRGEGPSKSPLK
ncbi:hypothetical protein TrVE_jg11880 [Triparma verrucosa]|uniref:Uncharacterized protein n=1 Tax=Triparma verrucosa TaxID=1606542 RepID=A0A9W6Z7J0_9STRA|nr:hypothetical protein TrVE_jg11880 [Triparma verrucosa]